MKLIIDMPNKTRAVVDLETGKVASSNALFGQDLQQRYDHICAQYTSPSQGDATLAFIEMIERSFPNAKLTKDGAEDEPSGVVY